MLFSHYQYQHQMYAYFSLYSFFLFGILKTLPLISNVNNPMCDLLNNYKISDLSGHANQYISAVCDGNSNNIIVFILFLIQDTMSNCCLNL